MAALDRWMHAVVDAVAQPLWVIGPGGAVAHVNAAAGRLLGYDDARTLVGGSSHEMLHARRPDGSAYPAHECPIVHASSSGGDPHGVEVFVTRAGRPVDVAWRVADLPLPEHRLLSFAPQPGVPVGRGVPSASALRARIAARHRDPEFGVDVLARDAHVSVRTVQAVLGRVGESPATLIREHRLASARELLREGMPVAAAAYGAGFRDADTFARAFRRRFGVAPGAFARAAR
ncbi:helix-turn-helix domain-containing protein [Microbacterium sp. CnD16-F]|uniref:helix-turn-helix transcriptional regulator n=1 Tax=unclassified Microbacterium TaxID=2609290 RepID=UPI002097F9ED|nr:helix-turn-helix domain-containing protein [Microbacterium sp. CnD16-F]MCO7204163.1 helix-turn-helix domain-containing protein [Microbacterium sp. CnD16-F]